MQRFWLAFVLIGGLLAGVVAPVLGIASSAAFSQFLAMGIALCGIGLLLFGGLVLKPAK